ncbi:MAG: hypothetical protein ACM3Q2_17615 [Syntrophothermus sp.]
MSGHTGFEGIVLKYQEKPAERLKTMAGKLEMKSDDLKNEEDKDTITTRYLRVECGKVYYYSLKDSADLMLLDSNRNIFAIYFHQLALTG